MYSAAVHTKKANPAETTFFYGLKRKSIESLKYIIIFYLDSDQHETLRD